MSDEIPQWAKERVADLIGYNTWKEFEEYHTRSFGADDALRLGRAYAKLIAQHEQPQVDPDLVKAREICARVASDFSSLDVVDAYREGKFDDEAEVKIALSALKEARNG